MIILNFLTILILLIVSTGLYAQDVPLSWDKAEGADSYVVYWRTAPSAPGGYTGNSGTIKTTEYTVTGLPDTEHFFAVKGVNYCGNESDFSEEVSSCGIKTPVNIPPGLKINAVINVKITVE